MVASIAANMMGGKRGGGQFVPSDFFASLTDTPRTRRSSGPTDDQIIAGLMGWAALCGTPVSKG